MAFEPMMRYGLRRIAKAIQEYAAAQGWGPEEFRAYVQLRPDLSEFYLILVAPSFPGRTLQDWYAAVRSFLEKKLKDEPTLLRSISFNPRTFAQVAEGGIYGIPPSYIDINELLSGGWVGEPDPSPLSFGRSDW